MPISYIPAQLAGGNFDTFVVGFVPADVFTNVRVRGTVNPLGTTPDIGGGARNANNDTFVSARVSATADSGYLLVWDYGTRFLNLVRIDNGAIFVPQNGTDGPNVSTTVNGTDLTLPYVLQLDVVQNKLTGQLFAADGITQLAEISWLDNTYASGRSGIGLAINDDLGPANGEYRDVSQHEFRQRLIDHDSRALNCDARVAGVSGSDAPTATAMSSSIIWPSPRPSPC